MRDYLDMWTLEDFSDQAMGVDVPMLVVACQYDRENFREEDLKKTFLKYHPKAELATLENSGHCPM